MQHRKIIHLLIVRSTLEDTVAATQLDFIRKQIGVGEQNTFCSPFWGS